MRRASPLRAEELEARDVPVTFGVPWPDGEHLTLSLAPNGTPIAGRAGDLQSLLNQLGPQARLDVLRAFQSWVAEADINLGLVADDGSAFGTGGPVQGDPRFGDIRLGGLPLARDVLADTAPYAVANNYSGDVVVNTAGGFGPAGRDLFTALLQEAGHSFGVGNSPDLGSVMYEYYLGARSGLSTGDVNSIRALYGPRVPDKFEGAAGNETLATASRYTGPLSAELTTRWDVDTYRFTAGLLTRSVTVGLKAAGLSLLTARVELLDANGNVLASAVATDPTANDLTLSLGQVRAGATYFVRVSAANPDVFGVGAYRLQVSQNSLLTDVTGVVDDLLTETGLNDTLLTATSLLSRTLSVGPQTEYEADGGFGSSSDVDWYRVSVPAVGASRPVNLLTTVWGQGGAVLNPWVEAYDLFGNRLPAEVVTADGNTTTVQVRGLTPGYDYFLKVSSDSGSRGGYHLSADLRTDAVEVPTRAQGTLSAAAPAAGTDFRLDQTNQVHLVLAADGAAGQQLTLVLTAADGTEADRLTVPTGRGRSIDLFLPAGTYRMTVRLTAGGGPVNFRLGALVVTDPVGATPADPTSNPDPPPPPPPPPAPATGSPEQNSDPPVWY